MACASMQLHRLTRRAGGLVWHPCSHLLPRRQYAASANRFQAAAVADLSRHRYVTITRGYRRPCASLNCRTQQGSLHRTVACSAAVLERDSQTDAGRDNLIATDLSWPGRTRLCGTLTEADVDKEIAVCGWVHRYRNFGGVIFADIRDQSGLLQVLWP